MVEDLIHALRRIAKVSYGATIEEARSVSKTQREAADLIEQQAARIAELEAAIRKQANAARSLADATIRDASIRQGLAEKAYAESSPEVLASERQANAMLTEENDRLTARLTALESERDALLAAAGKEAAKCEPVAWAVYWGIGQMRPNSVHFEKQTAANVAAEIKSNTEIRPLYTAPTAALENGDGRDAESLPVTDEQVEAALAAFNEFPCPINGCISRSGNAEQMRAAIDAALSQKAGG